MLGRMHIHLGAFVGDLSNSDWDWEKEQGPFNRTCIVGQFRTGLVFPHLLELIQHQCKKTLQSKASQEKARP